MDVLILCQRKISKNIVDTLEIETTLITLKKYIDDDDNKNNYFYVTYCSDKEDGENCADIKQGFGPNTKCRELINKNINNFDIIIFNTCPLFLFKFLDIYQIWRLLKNNGKLFFTGISGTFITNDDIIEGSKKLIYSDIPIFIEKIFYRKSENNKYFYTKKKLNTEIYNILVDSYCDIIKTNNNLNYFWFLPEKIQKIFIEASRYCIKYNKGNIEIINKILYMN